MRCHAPPEAAGSPGNVGGEYIRNLQFQFEMDGKPTCEDCAISSDMFSTTFWPLLVGSFAIAVASAGTPYLMNWDEVNVVLIIVLPLCLAWLVLVEIAVKKFRWRGLWFLLGAPLAFWWPIGLAMMASACARNVRACP